MTSNPFAEGWKRGDPIGYIRREIPDFGFPPYDGQRYEALVPDTLDLAERAAFAVNVLTSATDPDADYEQYFWVDFRSNPPRMSHSYCDQCQNKFMEALPLVRIASGSMQNLEVDRRYMEVALRRIGPDGVSYTPLRGRPWALIGSGSWFVGESDGDQLIEPFFGGRLLSAMMLYHRRDGGQLWRREAERMVDGLADLAVDRGRYAYFSPSTQYVRRGSTEDIGKIFKLGGAHVAFVALSLAHVYRDTGYGRAIDLAGKLLRYSLEELNYFGEDGSFVADNVPQFAPFSHFHMHTYTLLAMFEYARLTGDGDMLEKVRKGFEYGRAHGNTLVGYFPEALNSWELEGSELCEVADMIALGLKLTELGVGDYWDDVDRWTRNMFAEGQITPVHAGWLERFSSQLPKSPVDPMNQTGDRVIARNIGAFGGWPEANDWDGGTVQCCTGNGTRAIYYLWDHVLDYNAGRLRVNLLLNRASRWADVDSHIPYTGRVDVRVKEPVDLWMRIPEWVKPGEARGMVDGTDRSLEWDGRYARLGEVKPGEVATLTFPIAERTETVWIEKRKYTLVIKGNDVVRMDPPGQVVPLYQRQHYRSDTTRWRQMERFISNETIHY